MKKFLLVALLGIAGAAFSNTISDNFDTPATPLTDGRDGWTHNYAWPSEGWANWPQGDPASWVTWATDGTDKYIQAYDVASGSAEFFVAPDKFRVNGGNFLGLTKASLAFRFRVLDPLAPGITQTDSGVRIYLVSGTSAISVVVNPTTTIPDFYTRNDWGSFTANLLDAGNFSIVFLSGSTPKTRDEILASVDRILIDGEIRSGRELCAIDDIVLTYNSGSGDQTVSSDFNTDPSEDPRAGWIHNRAAEGYTGTVNGDVFTRIFHDYDAFSGGYIRLNESALGSTDLFVAPNRYVVNGGNFARIESGSFGFDMTRLFPASVTAANRLGVYVRLYSGANYVERRWGAADLVNFYDNLLATETLSASIPDSTWTAGPTNRRVNVQEILASVDNVVISGDIVSGREVNALDNINFTYNNYPNVLRGTIVFGGLVGDTPKAIQVEYRQNGNVVLSTAAKVDSNGDYEVAAPTADGTYDISVKTKSWLRQTKSMSIVGGEAANVNFDLINGDADADNAITIFDYIVLSEFFDLDNSASNWLTIGTSGYAPDEADFDRDGAVTIFDYIILSDNFDLTGDE